MKIDNNIRDEKLQYDVNGQAENMSALSSDKIKMTGEEIINKYILLVKKFLPF